MSDATVKLEKLIAEAMLKMATADEASLRELEVRLLGRKGEMNAVLAELPKLPEGERAALGAAVNRAKDKLSAAFVERRRELAAELMSGLAESEWIDITEPGIAPLSGHIHPSDAAISEISELFSRIGFRRARYGEAETDRYAFEMLNMPPEHPARDEWETFFLKSDGRGKGRLVLTPHTSNAQGHEMERRRPPVRMVSIGKTYRRQSDVTHLPMFHQFEGLVIDKGIALTHLRGVLDYFAKNYFGPDRRTRLRPYHFQFTEPSFEVDISCGLCNGTGKINGANCRVCKTGWLELGGAGMVHPNVLKAGGIDPKIWSGFAFGWGLERTMMMRAGLQVPDIRLMYSNDFRFLNQF